MCDQYDWEGFPTQSVPDGAPIHHPVIHQFQGKKVDNDVDDLWETDPDGG